MDYYVHTGELFNVSQADQDEKSSLLFEQMEWFLNQELNAFPGEMLMKISAHGGEDQDLFDCLSDTLAGLCPPGHYFGESRHDTGIYGFWPVPNRFSEVHP